MQSRPSMRTTSRVRTRMRLPPLFLFRSTQSKSCNRLDLRWCVFSPSFANSPGKRLTDMFAQSGLTISEGQSPYSHLGLAHNWSHDQYLVSPESFTLHSCAKRKHRAT